MERYRQKRWGISIDIKRLPLLFTLYKQRNRCCKKESEEHDLSKNIVDLDIDEYFNNADLNKILEYYSINTIPCILEIKNNEVKIIEFEEIKKY